MTKLQHSACNIAMLAALSLTDTACGNSSALCDAIVAGDEASATRLVKRGADVNAADGCALLAAAQRGQVALDELLLEHKADPNRRITGDAAVINGATTPLQAAVMSHDVPTVRALLENGADARDDIGAFEVAINFGDVYMAALLLRRRR